METFDITGRQVYDGDLIWAAIGSRRRITHDFARVVTASNATVTPIERHDGEYQWGDKTRLRLGFTRSVIIDEWMVQNEALLELLRNEDTN